MTTPAHVVAGLLAFSRKTTPSYTIAAVAGSLAPDAPMFLFYGLHKLVLGTPENVLWGVAYFEPRWQGFFDLFNSVPLIALAALGAAVAGRAAMLAALGAMALHVAMDLPVHHDDAHRHFFPFSDWRFASPVSYWDPRYHGRLVTMAEGAFIFTGVAWLVATTRPRGAKTAAVVSVATYAVFVVFAVLVWSP